ncbi:TolC family outer membrane protein [Vibrio sp. 99-8-1]|uniref:TolC family outer membrane protein n=1 Tax=Vibrio sp. 99-8-1 TaxID=2607602 RepID=UPI001493CDFB|nr:TolC family outer membrane protein [Vibrio sp. 99-8-1]
MEFITSRITTIAALVGCFAMPVQAEDLMQVYHQALENDPVYRAGIYQHDASKEIYDQAMAVLLPTIKFDASRTENKQKIVSSDNKVYNKGSTRYPTDELNLSLTQSLYSYSNWAYFAQSKEEVKRAAYELEDVRQQLIMRVAEAYFTVLKKRDNYLGINAEVTALQKHFELVELKVSNGLARTTDLLDSEARYLQAQARQIEISNNLQDSLQGIREITGALPASLLTLGEEMVLARPDPYRIESWLENAQQNNPKILQKQSEYEAAREEIRRQQGGHYPTLDLVLSQNKNDTDGSLFGGGSEVDTQSVMLKMTVPIYAGGAVSSKVRETEALYNKTKDDLELVSRETARETRSAYTGVTSTISKVNALEKSVDAYEMAVEVKQTSFESGVATSVTVLDAVRDLFIARTEYSAARYDYLLNNLRLKRAIGTLNTRDIEQINAALNGADVSTDVDVMLQNAELAKLAQR